MPAISSAGAQRLQAVLDKQAKVLPCSFLTVVDAGKVLFDGSAGIFDPLDPAGKKVGQATSEDEGDVMFFASTTKLLTSITYLQLVDRGIISLDTDMREVYPPLAKASSRLFIGLDEEGEPQYKDNDTPVTLLHMLNQSSGVGMEFGDKVQSWKEYTRKTGGKGGGFVNSCKVEHLINTPFTFEAGSSYEYGNSAEWLALILPTLINGQSYESYLQEHICAPIGLKRTSFFPFDGKWEGRLLPTRWGFVSEKQDKIDWHKMGDVDEFRARLMNLPRSKEEIEYPVGGGGIYSHTGDYSRVLQHLLAHYLSLSNPSIPRPSSPLLSDKSVESLFKGTLDPRAYDGIAVMMSKIRGFGGEDGLKAGEADWTTGMALFLPDESRTSEAMSSGRKSGSVGWGGAAGTEYWIDPASGIAACYTTQAIVDNGEIVSNAKKEIEKLVYEVLEL